MAGSKEALILLKEWSTLDTFLTFLELVPVCEIVRQTNLHIGERGCGTELWRLDNLRRHFLYNQQLNSKSPPEMAIQIEVSRTNRLELLTWIRSNAVAHGAAIDKDILQAAVFKAPDSIATSYLSWTQNHYCDVLLLDGLVDGNLDYHESGMDLLQLSIRNGCSLEVVELLLSKGLKVHSQPAIKTETQNTMLHDALLSSSPDGSQIVGLLLDQGADCTQTGTRLSLLEASLLHARHGPKARGCLDIFQRLLDEGCPVPPQPRRLIDLLIQAGAVDELVLRVVDIAGEMKIQGWSPQRADLTWLPLVQAIFQGRETLARELIRRGADVHAHSNGGNGPTALQAACSSEISLGFIKHLVENGADVNEAPAEELGRTALQRTTSLQVVEFLLDHEADVNALSGRFDVHCHIYSRFGCRLRGLDVAAECGRLDLLEYLLKAGGRSGYGGLRGAILLAKHNGNLVVLSVLLDWERKFGSHVVEEEAKCQHEDPDAARLLSTTAYTQPWRLLA